MQRWRLCLLFAFLTSGALGQWLNYPDPRTPRTKDGKPNLTAPAPRASNRKPDLSGVWRTEFAPPGENSSVFDVPGDNPTPFSNYFFNTWENLTPPKPPIRPKPPN